MSEDKKVGYRKALVTAGYTLLSFVVGGYLLWHEKIEGGDFVDLMGTTGWVVMAFIAGNSVINLTQAVTERKQ